MLLYSLSMSKKLITATMVAFVLFSSIHAVGLRRPGVRSLKPTQATTPLRSNDPNTVQATAQIIGSKPLNYPNPFALRSGTWIGYRLNQASDITIQIFDPFGIRIKQLDIASGQEGGKIGYNRVDINLSTFDGFDLPSGPYPFLVKSADSVIGKGVMVIKP